MIIKSFSTIFGRSSVCFSFMKGSRVQVFCDFCFFQDYFKCLKVESKLVKNLISNASKFFAPKKQCILKSFFVESLKLLQNIATSLDLVVVFFSLLLFPLKSFNYAFRASKRSSFLPRFAVVELQILCFSFILVLATFNV